MKIGATSLTKLFFNNAPAARTTTGTVVTPNSHFAVSHVEPILLATTRPATSSAIAPSATRSEQPSPSAITVCAAPVPNNWISGGYTAGAPVKQTPNIPTTNLISGSPREWAGIDPAVAS